jgi:hypothetical protein
VTKQRESRVVRIDGFCQGCQEFTIRFLVALDRSWCAACFLKDLKERSV